MELHALVADHVERHPGCVDQAVRTLERWAGMGIVPAARLSAWRRLLNEAQRGPAGMRALLAVLRGEAGEDARLRAFSPFAGVLTREQRRSAFLKCAYDH